MGLGIYKRGKSWYIDFWENGERYVERLGQVSMSFAKEEATRRRAAIIEKRLRPKAKDPLLEKFIDKYLAEVSVNKAPKSHARDKTSTSHLKRFFAGKRISRISETDIHRYKRDRKDEIYTQKPDGSLGSINRELALLSHAFNVAKLPNPVKGSSDLKNLGGNDFLMKRKKAECLKR